MPKRLSRPRLKKPRRPRASKSMVATIGKGNLKGRSLGRVRKY